MKVFDNLKDLAGHDFPEGTEVLLGGDAVRHINVNGSALTRNRRDGLNEPTVLIRDEDDHETILRVRRAVFSGEIHYSPEAPLVDSHGRADCYITVVGPIRITF